MANVFKRAVDTVERTLTGATTQERADMLTALIDARAMLAVERAFTPGPDDVEVSDAYYNAYAAARDRGLSRDAAHAEAARMTIGDAEAERIAQEADEAEMDDPEDEWEWTDSDEGEGA